MAQKRLMAKVGQYIVQKRYFKEHYKLGELLGETQGRRVLKCTHLASGEE